MNCVAWGKAEYLVTGDRRGSAPSLNTAKWDTMWKVNALPDCKETSESWGNIERQKIKIKKLNNNI